MFWHNLAQGLGKKNSRPDLTRTGPTYSTYKYHVNMLQNVHEIAHFVHFIIWMMSILHRAASLRRKNRSCARCVVSVFDIFTIISCWIIPRPPETRKSLCPQRGVHFDTVWGSQNCNRNMEVIKEDERTDMNSPLETVDLR